VNNYRNSCLTAPGICIKRNIVLGIIILFYVYHLVKQSLLYRAVLPELDVPLGGFVAVYSLVAVEFFLLIAVCAVFFWIVSKSISISWNESALEQTPPKIPLSSWSESELQPEGRRQIFVDSVVLLCIVPLILLLASLGSSVVQSTIFPNSIYFLPMPIVLEIDTLIKLLVVLVVLTVLWCSYNPSKRLLGFARLFLIGGVLTFCLIEYRPLFGLAMQYFLNDFCSWWFGGAWAPTIWAEVDTLKFYFSWHLTAGAFLVYSLLAAAFCYLLRAGER